MDYLRRLRLLRTLLPVAHAPHDIMQVAAVETLLQHMRLLEAQPCLDVFRHLRRCRGGQCQHGHLRQQFAHIRYPQVRRAEIVTPLGDAVRFVHGYQAYRQHAEPLAESLALQALGRHVQEVVGSELAVVQCRLLLVVQHAGVDGSRADVAPPQVLHLVFHQRYQRRDDQTEPVPDHGRHLEAQAFSPARRHQRQRVSARQYGLHYLPLQGAEVVVVPISLQSLSRGHHS